MATPDPTSGGGLPTSVRKRDGRVEAFDPDKISQALFAATESLGRPDAFLARELTDGVLHFLADEVTEPTPSTQILAEVIEKVVRELRQPELARAFSRRAAKRLQKIGRELSISISTQGTPGAVVKHCLEAYSLEALFGRDLAAAHRDGLLTIEGLDEPLAVEGVVLDPPSKGEPTWLNGALTRAVVGAQPGVGQVIAIDGPDWLPGLNGQAFVEELTPALHAFGLRAVVNLHSSTPPPWIATGISGPLFDASATMSDGDGAGFRQGFLDCWRTDARARALIAVNWHLREQDEEPDWQPLISLVGSGVDLTIACDRAKLGHDLGAGLERQHPATLLTVRLQLPALAAIGGVTGDVEVFLIKLGSLARFCVAAAVQKRNYLRKQGPNDAPWSRGFVLDRARLLVAPIGLEHVVKELTGSDLTNGSEALALARRVLVRLREVLVQEGRVRLVETCLESTARETMNPPAGDQLSMVKQQLRVSAELQAAASSGSHVVSLTPNREELIPLLQFARKQASLRKFGLHCE